MFFKTLDKLFGTHHLEFPLNLQPLPCQEISRPNQLSFSLVTGNGLISQAMVKSGDEISPGQPLCAAGPGLVQPSPVKGKVVTILGAPDLRGGPPGQAILVEPEEKSAPVAFPPLDPEQTNEAELSDRIKEAGIQENCLHPGPLMEQFQPGVKTVVIQAADQEPGVCASLQLFRDRKEEIPAAARLLGKLARAERVCLALPEPMRKEAESLGLELLGLPPYYPETLAPLVAVRAGDPGSLRIIALETALAALDAVKEGKIQDTKRLTVLSHDGRALGNYQVPLGITLKDLFPLIGLEAGEEDKVVAGGPMRGFAQYSLDSSVDAGVNALLVVPARAIVPWSDEPCINCGGCVDACPVKLQVQLIGRYAEFGFFDRAGELGLKHCIDCGLCAAVCTARRPLTQLIRLARQELAKMEVPEDSVPDTEETPEQEAEQGA